MNPPSEHQNSADRDEMDERGTVKIDGDKRDRRPDRVRLIATAVVVMLLVAGVATIVALKNRYDLAQQEKGRRTAIALFCNVTETQTQVIKNILAASAGLKGKTPADSDRLIRDSKGRIVGVIPGRFSSELEKIGGPSAQQRLRRSRIAAIRFEDQIARSVIQAAGRRDLLSGRRSNAILDCEQVLQATRG